jgi:hypothetical protein
MAVPSSGAITMLGIAQERKYGLYGFGTISFPITMFDLLNGGGSNGFPALNACPQFSTPSYSMSGWYGYNQTASCGSCDAVLLRFSPSSPSVACNSSKVFTYYAEAPGDAPWENGTPIYSDAQCTNPAAPGWYSNGEQVAQYFGEMWTVIDSCG